MSEDVDPFPQGHVPTCRICGQQALPEEGACWIIIQGWGYQESDAPPVAFGPVVEICGLHCLGRLVLNGMQTAFQTMAKEVGKRAEEANFYKSFAPGGEGGDAHESDHGQPG